MYNSINPKRTKNMFSRSSPDFLPNFILEGHDLPISITRRKSMKRIVVKLSKTYDEILMSAPPHIPLKDLKSFIEKAQSWILKQLNKKVEKQDIPIGETISLNGQRYSITHIESNKRSYKIKDTDILIKCPAEDLTWCSQNVIKKIAQEKCFYWSQYFAEKSGLNFNKVTIRDVKSRWGSCSALKNLNYNWRIILAPEDVLKYLCAHEVSHLRHMNHSKEFWAHVKTIFPEYKVHQQWLKHQGHHLYRYG